MLQVIPNRLAHDRLDKHREASSRATQTAEVGGGIGVRDHHSKAMLIDPKSGEPTRCGVAGAT